MPEKNAVRIDQELVKALSHPLRVRILEALQGRVASPTELSKEMSESLGVIAYHANTLVECGCLELVRTQPRRGALEHFFTATPRSFIGHQDWRRTPLSVRGGVTAAAVQSFVDQAAAAVKAGTIDSREDTTLSWMPMTVDETGWREVAEIMDKVLKLATAVHAKSAKRLGGARGIPLIVGLAAFEASGPETPPR
ncbi:MAG: winged helix-turn-helix domain-containing protein [Solirubrobacterales bacterium]